MTTVVQEQPNSRVAINEIPNFVNPDTYSSDRTIQFSSIYEKNQEYVLNIKDADEKTLGIIYNNILPSKYIISLKNSKLIPYFAWQCFNHINFSNISIDGNMISLPTNINYINSHYSRHMPLSSLKYVLSGQSGRYRTINVITPTFYININGTRHRIRAREHFMYSPEYPNILENNVVDDVEPIIMIALCSSRDQNKMEPFNVNKSILVVNTNQEYAPLMKPVNKYIKLYKENGIKNILYTDNPNYYIFDQNVEKIDLMRKSDKEEYLLQFLP